MAGNATAMNTENPVTESKVEQAYRLLEEQIVTMALEPGTLLSESELVATLGLGRTPVREALQRLAQEHLVAIMPRRGTRVTSIDIKQQLRLLEVRRVLEQLNMELACRRANGEQKRRFTEIAEQMLVMAVENNYMGFLRLDSEFNALLSNAADNEFSSAQLAQMHGLSRRFWHCHHLQADDLILVAQLHADSARAIAGGDERAAVDACGKHMDYIQSFAKSTLDR